MKSSLSFTHLIGLPKRKNFPFSPLKFTVHLLILNSNTLSLKTHKSYSTVNARNVTFVEALQIMFYPFKLRCQHLYLYFQINILICKIKYIFAILFGFFSSFTLALSIQSKTFVALCKLSQVHKKQIKTTHETLS